MVLVLYTPRFVMKNGNSRAARHIVNFGSISVVFVVFFFTSTRKTRRAWFRVSVSVFCFRFTDGQLLDFSR